MLVTYNRIIKVVDDRIDLFPRAIEEELRSIYRQSKLRAYYFFSYNKDETLIYI